jgi:hypothetical protein
MAKFFAQGRLGTELFNLPLYALEMLVNHSPDGDPWLRGETLDVIIKRIAFLSGRDHAEVKEDVLHTLKKKHERAIAPIKSITIEANLITSDNECGGFGGTLICRYLETDEFEW